METIKILSNRKKERYFANFLPDPIFGHESKNKKMPKRAKLDILSKHSNMCLKNQGAGVKGH